MSTTTRTAPKSTRKTTPRTAPKTAPRTTPKPAPKAARPAAGRRRGTSRAPFVLLVVGLLGGALVTLLLLNTVLAQDAFALTELQRDNQQLTQRRQALQEEIAREEAPGVLAQKARALGMEPAQRPQFVDARTGKTTSHKGRQTVSRLAPAAQSAAAGAGLRGGGDR